MALIEVELVRVMLVETSDQQVVVLQEKDGDGRSFPIVIGIFEAVAIHRVLRQETLPRPMTHDLMVNVIEDLGAKVERMVVRDLVDGTFLGALHLRTDDGVMEADCRPSDGLAIAVRTNCPIFVEEKVLDALS